MHLLLRTLPIILLIVLLAACAPAQPVGGAPAGSPTVSSTQTTASREQAERALRAFLDDLAEGRLEPGRYAQAAQVFDGWTALTDRYPTLRFSDNAAMLQYACESDTLACYPVHQVRFVEIDASGLVHFQVQFLRPDGTLLRSGSQDWFDFRVQNNFPEQPRVLDLPLFE